MKLTQEYFVEKATKEAAEFVLTGKFDGDFRDGITRMLDNEYFINLAAAILSGADQKKIYSMLIDAMFSERFIENEVSRIKSLKIDEKGKIDFYENETRR